MGYLAAYPSRISRVLFFREVVNRDDFELIHIVIGFYQEVSEYWQPPSPRYASGSDRYGFELRVDNVLVIDPLLIKKACSGLKDEMPDGIEHHHRDC